MSGYIWVSGVLPDRSIMSLFDMFVLVAGPHLARQTGMDESKNRGMLNPDLESESECHKTANSNIFLEKGRTIKKTKKKYKVNFVF